MTAPLDKSANGTTVSGHVGKAITIHLNGNPTTGYSWRAKDGDADAYEVAVDYQQGGAAGGGPPMMGAPGVFKIVVTPKKSGTHPVNFVYDRSFEPENLPVETFGFSMNVQ